ncbi:MAG: ATP-grasp domain-containing protein [Deltaproteobacteria bacterium]|nr:ATP-grasp domain-containing protein [Deltaproteobacteria bacterium]
MNLVFVSPHFPPQYHLFCVAARRRGINVVGVGDAPFESLRAELAAALAEYVYVSDMNDDDAMIRAMGYMTSRHGKIDRIDSLNEHWLEVEARLRENFNVFGQKPADTARNRSKSAMREVFRAAGVPCTEGTAFTTAAQATVFAKQHGYPLVIKPDTGVGAAKTYKVRNAAELDAALADNLDGYVIEKFATGKLGSFDGLVDRDGRIVICISNIYSSGIMEIVNERRPLHYYTRREIPAKLEDYGKRVIAAFGIRERFFHIEFFETDDDFVALEVNVRPPGGFTTDMMNYAIEGDIYDLWARVLSEGTIPDFTYERRYHVMYVGRRRGAPHRFIAEEIRVALGDRFILYREMPDAFAGAMGDEMFLLRDSSLEPLLEAERMIQETAP